MKVPDGMKIWREMATSILMELGVLLSHWQASASMMNVAIIHKDELNVRAVICCDIFLTFSFIFLVQAASLVATA
jgi:hypothetical protein